MISLEKYKILTPKQKLSKNVGILGKIILATGFEKLPKVPEIAQSGHTVGGRKANDFFQHETFHVWLEMIELMTYSIGR